MYKYMEVRPQKVNKTKTIEDANTGIEDADDDVELAGVKDFDESEEDAEMEQFAQEEMDREMKRMANGAPGGMPDSDEEEISLE